MKISAQPANIIAANLMLSFVITLAVAQSATAEGAVSAAMEAGQTQFAASPPELNADDKSCAWGDASFEEGCGDVTAAAKARMCALADAARKQAPGYGVPRAHTQLDVSSSAAGGRDSRTDTR
jgi:hypothetical protein